MRAPGGSSVRLDRSINREGGRVGERIGIAGGGAIASGLACVAAAAGPVVVWCRRPRGAAARIDRLIERAGGRGAGNVRLSDDPAALRDATFVVEAVAEDADVKETVLRQLGDGASDRTILATTTSSLSVARLARAAGRPDRFVGLHVFNPVPRMDLVELAFPPAAAPETRDRARALCVALGKTPVEVPDTPGFVVNRLLFPFLFDAVRLLEDSGVAPEAIDDCMRMGAGHPMGPLALLDYVGLDVAAAIGRTLGLPVPAALSALVDDGALGKKTGRGFYAYPEAAPRAAAAS
jgi:3-hydroxyacyl-CoA dehydrogenase